jgi:hypothetical protein
MNIAIIENGIVVNTIIADSVEAATELTGLTCVEYTNENQAFIGLGYDGSTFEQPEVDPRTLEFTPEEWADFQATRAAAEAESQE